MIKLGSKTAFKRLREAGPEIVSQVDNMLLSGEPPSKVAEWLQEDQKLFKDLEPGSVKKNLERYRALDLKDRKLKELIETTRGVSVIALQRKINAQDELEALFLIQKNRLDKVLTHEDKTLKAGIVLKYVSDEIRLTKDMLVELGKMQLETGAMIRAPKKVSGSTVNPDGEITAFEWTEEQEKLHRELENFDSVEDIEVMDADDI